jgi:hypothetical protein
MPASRPKRRPVTARRGKAADVADDAFAGIPTEGLPGSVAMDEPVGAPHVDEEPGGIAEPILASGWEGDDGDLHALWAEREAAYHRKRLQLNVIVGATMFALVAIWALSLGEGIGGAVATDGDGALADSLFDRFRSYEARFRALSGEAGAPAGEVAGASFVEALRDKVAEAATTSTGTVDGRR